MKATVDKLQALAQELTRPSARPTTPRRNPEERSEDIKVVKAKIGEIENEARTTALELRRPFKQ
jgi:hypothetical protein